jgi:ubiquinone/menaquinone biosynthesis C-methylase UbiE
MEALRLPGGVIGTYVRREPSRIALGTPARHARQERNDAVKWNRSIALGLLVLSAVLGVLNFAQNLLANLPLAGLSGYLTISALVALVAGALLLLRDQLQRRSARPAETSQITAFIGGRVRTRGVPYQMPLDIEEMNRLDFQHYMLRATLQGNYAAPLRAPQSILDVGTGTGRWAREMAVEFPRANVVGLDLNPPPADEAAESRRHEDLRPANYTFVAGNVLEGLPFAEHSFDLVHMRALVTAIPHAQWPQVIGELARVTRLGGWVESLEVTPLVGGGPATELLMTWLVSLMAARGVEFADGGQVAERMHAAGLEQVALRRLDLPCGDFGGRVAKMLATDWFSVLGALGGMMVARQITSPEYLEQAVAGMRAELADPTVRAVMPTYIVIGQRGARALARITSAP